jgi:hypothetical protein
MSRSRIAISLLIVCHLTAITLGALPDPAKIDTAPAGDRTMPDVFSTALTPRLNAITRHAAAVLSDLWMLTDRLRKPTNLYLSATGLFQPWSMFFQPPTEDRYLRLRYYVGTSSHLTLATTELVLPAHREDRIRLLASFRDSYIDKACEIALVRFFEQFDTKLIRLDARSTELPQDLAPVARYFAKRYQQQRLLPAEHIVRTEIWQGAAPIPPPGQTLSPEIIDARRAVLERYYSGPIEEGPRKLPNQSYHTGEREADIQWVLIYFEEP